MVQTRAKIRKLLVLQFIYEFACKEIENQILNFQTFAFAKK